jgi:hypothetical protein
MIVDDIILQARDFTIINYKPPEEILMNGATYKEVVSEIVKSYSSTGDSRFGRDIPNINGIKISINEDCPQGQMYFKQGGSLTPIVISNIGTKATISRFKKQRKIKINLEIKKERE